MDNLSTIPDDTAWRIHDQTWSLFKNRAEALAFLRIGADAYHRRRNRTEIHPADMDIEMEARARELFSTLRVQQFAEFRHWRRVRMAENGGKMPKRSE